MTTTCTRPAHPTPLASDIPDYYQPGSYLLLRIAEEDVSMTVVRVFTPFTMSQVLVVQSPEEVVTGLPLPPGSLVILKVYDPRFYSHRTAGFRKNPHLWNHVAETAAAEKRTAPYNPDFWEGNWPEEDDEAGWEEWYYQNAELHFRCEVAAYKRLTSLQGTAIPRCFVSGKLQLEQHPIAPRVLFLEYLPDAKTLCDVDPHVVELPLAQSLVVTAREFGKLGVVHNDPNPANILLLPGARPTCAVVIDFAEAGAREEEETDEEWEVVASFHGDVLWMKK